MKKLLVLLLTIFALNSCEKDPEIIDIDAEKKMPKVDVCHKGKIINISKNALKAHLKHGDVQLIDVDGDGYMTLENECLPYGDCDDTNADVNPAMEEICDDGVDNNCDGEIDEGCEVQIKTYVPDDSFEQQLINKGYDVGPLDDYVLTNNIKNVTQLSLSTSVDIGIDLPLLDLTGIEDFSSLKEFSFSHNFTNYTGEIDLSKNTELTTLSLDLYSITELDLSNNMNLSNLQLTSMFKLTQLNVQNGNNEFLTFYIEAPILNCFQVDDATWSTVNWSTDYIYSEDCY